MTWHELLMMTCQELVGLRDVEEVTVDGSPCGNKAFVLWNPPITQLPQVHASSPPLSKYLFIFVYVCMHVCIHLCIHVCECTHRWLSNDLERGQSD